MSAPDQIRNRRVRTTTPLQPNQIPPALRRNRRVVVQFDDYGNSTELQIIRRAGDNYNNLQILNYFANLLKRRIYQISRRISSRTTNPQIRNRVRFSIFMNNVSNLGHNQSRTNVTLPELNGEYLEDMFEEATANGSNPDLDLYSLVWNVWVNPNSLQVGGSIIEDERQSGLAIIPKNIKIGKNEKFKSDDLGCASRVLALGLFKKQIIKLGNNTSPFLQPQFTRKVKELQDSLNFEDPHRVSIIELSNFTKLYPTTRLTIITDHSTLPEIHTGQEYSFNEDPKLDLTIYIYLDLSKEHYRLITGPVQFYKKTR